MRTRKRERTRSRESDFEWTCFDSLRPFACFRAFAFSSPESADRQPRFHVSRSSRASRRTASNSSPYSGFSICSAGSATVRTATKCYLLQLPREAWNEVIVTHPQVLEYASEVADSRQTRLL